MFMGIYDRDYERERDYDDGPGIRLRMPQTMTMRLILVTSIVYLVQLLTGNVVTQFGMLQSDWYLHPWKVYTLLTYGFLHAPNNILANMYGLWLFGGAVEARYGSREFLLFYLTAVVVGGLAWTLAEIPVAGLTTMYGASAACVAVMVVYAFLYPHQTVLMMMLFPMPMWALAVVLTGYDILGATRRSGDVAFTAHLGGAAFGALYYKFGWRISSWIPTQWKMPRLSRRPPLRVHDPLDDEDEATEDVVDNILRKIREHGQDSLTSQERRILEEASREYQKRRH
jgi:membrane associated rhomboid family serine protease